MADLDLYRALPLAHEAGRHLESKGFDHGRLDAELLMAGLIGTDRLNLYLQHDRPLEPPEVERYREAIRRRLRHEPVQYILGTAAFREIEIRVDRRALIPRPETEVLVGVVLDWAARREGDLSALDVGTGSGVIALSLLAEGGFARAVGTDASAEALALAGENARALGLSERLELRQGSLWQPVAAGERFDAIVSNPPYVAEGERDGLDAEVAEWEPAAALFAGADGLDVLGPLVEGAPERLERGGLLAVEVGLGQAEAVAERMENSGAYVDVRVVKDLTGRPRIVAGQLANTAGTEHDG